MCQPSKSSIILKLLKPVFFIGNCLRLFLNFTLHNIIYSAAHTIYEKATARNIIIFSLISWTLISLIFLRGNYLYIWERFMLSRLEDIFGRDDTCFIVIMLNTLSGDWSVDRRLLDSFAGNTPLYADWITKSLGIKCDANSGTILKILTQLENSGDFYSSFIQHMRLEIQGDIVVKHYFDYYYTWAFISQLFWGLIYFILKSLTAAQTITPSIAEWSYLICIFLSYLILYPIKLVTYDFPFYFYDLIAETNFLFMPYGCEFTCNFAHYNDSRGEITCCLDPTVFCPYHDFSFTSCWLESRGIVDLLFNIFYSNVFLYPANVVQYVITSQSLLFLFLGFIFSFFSFFYAIFRPLITNKFELILFFVSVLISSSIVSGFTQLFAFSFAGYIILRLFWPLILFFLATFLALCAVICLFFPIIVLIKNVYIPFYSELFVILSPFFSLITQYFGETWIKTCLWISQSPDLSSYFGLIKNSWPIKYSIIFLLFLFLRGILPRLKLADAQHKFWKQFLFFSFIIVIIISLSTD